MKNNCEPALVLEFYCLFFRTSWRVSVLNSAIFNSFHNRVKVGAILEGLQNFGEGGWIEHPTTLGTPLLRTTLGIIHCSYVCVNRAQHCVTAWWHFWLVWWCWYFYTYTNALSGIEILCMWALVSLCLRLGLDADNIQIMKY